MTVLCFLPKPPAPPTHFACCFNEEMEPLRREARGCQPPCPPTCVRMLCPPRLCTTPAPSRASGPLPGPHPLCPLGSQALSSSSTWQCTCVVSRLRTKFLCGPPPHFSAPLCSKVLERVSPHAAASSATPQSLCYPFPPWSPPPAAQLQPHLSRLPILTLLHPVASPGPHHIWPFDSTSPGASPPPPRNPFLTWLPGTPNLSSPQIMVSCPLCPSLVVDRPSSSLPLPTSFKPHRCPWL